MKRIIIVLCFIILIGCMKTKDQTDVPLQESNTSIHSISLEVMSTPTEYTCFHFTGFDGKSASINLDPNGVHYYGNLSVKSSARIFFNELHKLLCECYCDEGWMDK